MSEIKAAFAERAIQFLKHIICRYIEDHGEKIVPKLQQFVSTLNCRKNRIIGKPTYVKNSDFLSILYNKLFKKHTKPKFKIGDGVKISKNDILFRKRFKPQFTDDFFDFSAISTKKTSYIHHQRYRKRKNSGKILQKRAIEKMFRLKVSHFLK